MRIVVPSDEASGKEDCGNDAPAKGFLNAMRPPSNAATNASRVITPTKVQFTVDKSKGIGNSWASNGDRRLVYLTLDRYATVSSGQKLTANTASLKASSRTLGTENYSFLSVFVAADARRPPHASKPAACPGRDSPLQNAPAASAGPKRQPADSSPQRLAGGRTCDEPLSVLAPCGSWVTSKSMIGPSFVNSTLIRSAAHRACLRSDCS